MMRRDWEEYIKKPGFCSRCKKEFAESEEYYAVLLERGEEFVRYDFCLNCWSSELEAESFSFWRGRIPQKDRPAKVFVDNNILMDLFREIVAKEDEGKAGFLFVLSLMLMRKRLLRIVSTSYDESGRELWTVRLQGDDNEYRLVNPELTDEDIERIKEDMESIFWREL